MKILLVLLLLRSVSGDQTMTKGDQELLPHQPGLQGLYSALREVRGLLSELRVELVSLQSENRGTEGHRRKLNVLASH